MTRRTSAKPDEKKETLILITCPDDTSESIYEQLSNEERYRLIRAGDGLEAVRQACEQAPQLILMDMQLPLLDGFSAVRQIRGLLPLRATRIIFLSQYDSLEFMDAAIAAGVDEYLVKPTDPGLLRRTIDKYV